MSQPAPPQTPGQTGTGVPAAQQLQQVYVRTNPPPPPAVRPTIGGIQGNIAWTGGHPDGRRRTPKTTFCFRPTDFKDHRKTYEACTAGLAKEYRLSKKNKEGTYDLVSFFNSFKRYIENHGLDSVFYVDTGRMTYVDLIREYATVSEAEITAHVQSFTDDYDQTNLEWSYEALINSIDAQILIDVQKYIDSAMTGPHLYWTIMTHIHSTTSPAMRTLIDKLRDMRLKDEPGENVETYTNKVDAICMQLQGANKSPADVSVLVTIGLKTSTVEEFRLRFIGIYNELEDNPSTYTFKEVIRKAEHAYRSLVDSKGWGPLAKQPGTDAAFQYGGGDRFKNVTCWVCGQKGHTAKKCPNRKTDAGDSDGKGAPSGNGGKEKHPAPWWKQPPKKDESHEKNHDGKKWFWCGKCGKWNTSHNTSQHRSKKKVPRADKEGGGVEESKEEGSEEQTPAANPAMGRHVPPSLRLASGFYCREIQEN